MTGPARRRGADLRDRAKARRSTAIVYRSAVGLLGGLIVIVGLALIPLPGPGWLIVFVGLGVLATEFSWAERLLERAKAMVGSWTQWVAQRSWPVRLLIGAAGIGLLVGMYLLYRSL